MDSVLVQFQFGMLRRHLDSNRAQHRALDVKIVDRVGCWSKGDAVCEFEVAMASSSRPRATKLLASKSRIPAFRRFVDELFKQCDRGEVLSVISRLWCAAAQVQTVGQEHARVGRR